METRKHSKHAKNKRVGEDDLLKLFKEKPAWKPEDVMTKLEIGKGTTYYHANKLIRSNDITREYAVRTSADGTPERGRRTVTWTLGNNSSDINQAIKKWKKEQGYDNST